MRAALLILLAAAVPAAVLAAPQHGRLAWTDQKPQPRGESLLKTAMLEGHNQARRLRSVPPLSWDPALARDAEAYARHLARTSRFEHDRHLGRGRRQGENLFMGTRGAYRYSEMIGLLVDERRHFRPGRFPHVSRTGEVANVGHYTQIIWPASQRVGCALASNKRNDYLVCRYIPAGNIAGTYLR